MAASTFTPTSAKPHLSSSSRRCGRSPGGTSTSGWGSSAPTSGCPRWLVRTTTHRYVDARARENCAGTSPVTRASGKKTVLVRYVHNNRLIDALGRQGFSALTGSPGARAYYDELRQRGMGHRAALRQLVNRLVGILHGYLKTGTIYDETAAWPHHAEAAAA
jgi:hypothetical protein